MRSAIRESYPFYLAGEPREPNHDLPVHDKYTGEVAARVAQAYAGDIEAAIAAAAAAAPDVAAMPTHARRAVLEHCIARFTQRSDELAESLCVEAGKPITDARGEVTRLLETFRACAAACEDPAGEVLRLDTSPRTAGYIGMTRRVPVGPCSFFTPFNFPLNLVAHKVGPAIAAGCPFILKPSPRTPLGALIIGEVLAETELPRGAFSVLTCSNDDAAPLVADDRLKLLSFTGSDEVGWDLKARSGRKKVHLELGGNAAAIVDETADVEDAVARLVRGAFYQSGQSCISVQRLFVHRGIHAGFRDRFVAAASELRAGNPRDEHTFIGPLIDEASAVRIERWVAAAVDRGARVLLGGRRDGVMYPPTVLENVPADAELCREEAFGPVVVLDTFDDFGEALARVNGSRFGLQAGVFTRDLRRAMRAWEVLEVGGVIIGDAPSWRVDPMPYGGVKDSGLGREGPRAMIEELTEPRLMVIRREMLP